MTPSPMPSTASGPTPAPARTVPTRRISFEESLQDLPKHFAVDGDLIGSHLMASLSAVFPDGEDFFVRSVRSMRDRVTDPVLKRQVAGFIGQEAVHGREHRVFNDRLDELGYPTKRLERLTRWGLGLRERFLPPVSNLAATAALEHFTATFAEVLLSSDEARRLTGHDGVRDLFVWHALEESEHKAVAFDVYRAVGGSERLRVFTMKALTIGFLGGMTVQVVVSLLGDRATYRRGALRASWRQFKASPFMDVAVWHRLRDYNRPDFHPDDHDTTELVARYRDELFGAEGRLTPLLAGATAS
jgi:uncharacterized protein